MSAFSESFLLDVLSQPTAPYREEHVSRLFEAAFKKAGVPFCKDPIGNIIVGAGSLKEYQSLLSKASFEPLRCFIAHMDHPGFHGAKWLSDTDLEATWFGGTPTYYLENTPLWIASRKGWEAESQIKSVTLKRKGSFDTIDTLRMSLPADIKKQFPRAQDLFGGYRFKAPAWKEGSLIYTKAADDLVGAFAVASLALAFLGKKKKSRVPFLGLLTRAEEVGWIGAVGHFNLGYLSRAKRKVLCVSLETSRTLPGAEIGKGPVVRLGDRTTVFDPSALRMLSLLAEKILPGAYQRRIMDGGSCEASPAVAFGLPAVGISIPLGNYHNQSFEGGPGSMGPMGPAPEFVHLDDIRGMFELCKGLLTHPLARATQLKDPWGSFRKTIVENLRKAKPYL